MSWDIQSHLCAGPPAARPPVLLTGAHRLRTPLHVPPARRGSPPERPAGQHAAAQRDLCWCWTGAAGGGRRALQGSPGGKALGRAAALVAKGNCVRRLRPKSILYIIRAAESAMAVPGHAGHSRG
jgi:hypothetical protein